MRILTLSDPIWKPTGYGKVMYNIVRGLCKAGHKVGHIPMLREWFGPPTVFTTSQFHPKDPDPQEFLVVPSGETEFGEDVLPEFYYRFDADCMIYLKDLWVQQNLHMQPIQILKQRL